MVCKLKDYIWEPLKTTESFSSWRIKSPNGVILGFVEKQADTSTEQHPFKVFVPKFVAGSAPQYGEKIANLFTDHFHSPAGFLTLEWRTEQARKRAVKLLIEHRGE